MLPLLKVFGILVKKFQFCSCSVGIIFLRIEMDSALSKTYGALIILKFDNGNLYLQKCLPSFIKILSEFP